ncbi:MAG TPA: UDP-N-acetylglucosamine 2-epimerase (non-hydrolyzing) [Firmicutes bacterium]|jgi:UDP-N-acetylglucosamine 2-epimerase|nr:UDP-N-acetylglucosamine 2-epimerase (non-hydrolyzing) [Bacillota bacterium]HCX78412.1 UDP-N-acetylglucosamine 2-epimerase (non-hydrolyzing) [Bacillota bacterium]
MKVLTVLGARPQFIKAAAVSRVLRQYHQEIIVHTGQHYDENMSAVFFQELSIPLPDYNLAVGSGSHGTQTGAMLAEIEQIIIQEQPDWVMVYGDTNSTVAGALAAAKLYVPVVHVEAGLRSFNRRMPEEINRVVTDSISTILACPTITAVTNLKNEGFTNIYSRGDLLDITTRLPAVAPERPLVVNTGDVMYDAILHNLEIARRGQMPLGIQAGDDYILATVHRAENTDIPDNLGGVLRGLAALGRKVVFPLHPRTKKTAARFGLGGLLEPPSLHVIEPVGYLDMLRLMDNAAFIVTDSGGVQKEAFILGKPCITLRDETEWLETVATGWNVLVGLGGRDLIKNYDFKPPKENQSAPYGDGRAGERIAALLDR